MFKNMQIIHIYANLINIYICTIFNMPQKSDTSQMEGKAGATQLLPGNQGRRKFLDHTSLYSHGLYPTVSLAFLEDD